MTRDASPGLGDAADATVNLCGPAAVGSACQQLDGSAGKLMTLGSFASEPLTACQPPLAAAPPEQGYAILSTLVEAARASTGTNDSEGDDAAPLGAAACDVDKKEGGKSDKPRKGTSFLSRGMSALKKLVHQKDSSPACVSPRSPNLSSGNMSAPDVRSYASSPNSLVPPPRRVTYELRESASARWDGAGAGEQPGPLPVLPPQGTAFDGSRRRSLSGPGSERMRLAKFLQGTAILSAEATEQLLDVPSPDALALAKETPEVASHRRKSIEQSSRYQHDLKHLVSVIKQRPRGASLDIGAGGRLLSTPQHLATFEPIVEI